MTNSVKLFVFIAISLFLTTVYSCKKETSPPRDKTCDEEMAEIDPVYIYSALHYMYDLENDTTNSERDSIYLKESGVKEKYNLLKAIRDSKSLQSDSIFKLFKAVHADYYYLQHISFTLPDKALYESNKELQEIIKKYNLTLVYQNTYNHPYTSFILKACPIINVYALIREIETKTKILNIRWDVIPKNIRPSHYWGYERRKFEITDVPLDNSKLVKIYIGFIDCPAGCINNYTWEFKVYNDFSVKHVRSYGRKP